VTAQEAAQKGRSVWSWLKGHRASIVIFAGGVSVLAASVSYEELNHVFLKLTGGGTVALNLISWLSEHFSKATGREVKEQISDGVADGVARRLDGQINSVQQVVNQMATAVMQLSAQVSQTEATRGTDHRENAGQLQEFKQEIEIMKVDHNEMREAIVHVGQAVEAVNKDFKMRPFRGEAK
jgi:hypothetical protein